MIGKTISHYKVLEKLGKGGMGAVYKAQDAKLKRIVALKFLPPELTRDADAKKRLIHEAQAASALQHNNICTIHEIDETPNDQMFICMDFYEGETLKKKIERGPLPLDEAIEIVTQIVQGLARAHEADIIHRDIKPANILITDRGEVKIVDFGLARAAGQTRITKASTTLGTVAYMSPEQARGEDADQRTDIWSFGVVLYEMLTGILPFKGDYEQAVIYLILNEDYEAITSLRGDVPEELKRIVDKALAKNPNERYQLIDDVLVDLQSIPGEKHIDTKTFPIILPIERHTVGREKERAELRAGLKEAAAGRGDCCCVWRASRASARRRLWRNS
jgi:serine/threonine protein kinase